MSRLVAALHLVLGLSLGAGVRFISQVLELAGLDPFMANSVRWHQDRAQTLERCVRSFGREERLRMCAVMKPKSITLCGDETFFPHGQICLVAIEPVSSFIVTDDEAGRRSGTCTAGRAVPELRVRFLRFGRRSCVEFGR